MTRSHVMQIGKLFLLGVLALSLCGIFTPKPAFAALGDEQNLVVEYRYSDRDPVPEIPQTVTQFGREFRLLGAKDAVLESTLPATRMYTFNISGLLTEEQMKDIALVPNAVLSPVEIVFEREVDRTVKIPGLKTNEVDKIKEYEEFDCTSAYDPSGFAKTKLKRVGVEFAATKDPKLGLPTGYEATVVYRGIETYTDIGYYTAQITYQTELQDGETNTYIIVAEYEPVKDPTIVVPIQRTETTTTVVTQEDQASDSGAGDAAEDDGTSRQTGNIFQDILDSEVPLGGPGAEGVWSLASLCMAALGVGLAGFSMVFSLGHRKIAKEAGRRRKNRILALCATASGVLPIAAWLILDDTSLHYMWINQWTPVVAALFAVTVILSIISIVDTVSASKQDDSSDSPANAGPETAVASGGAA